MAKRVTTVAPLPRQAPRRQPQARPALSLRGATMAGAAWPGDERRRDRPHAFQLGMPDIEHFPWRLWARALGQRARPGLAALPGERDPADPVWFEEPGYPGARAALLAAGARPLPVPVDAGGLDVDAGQRLEPTARAVYVTPSHQFPLGVTMSVTRRLALLAWARRAGALVLEDDYDSEFRYVGHPPPALQGLDDTGRVVYLGTFSKVLFPALRVGYLVVPPELVEAFTAACRFTGAQVPLLEQAALADFMTAGHFGRHVRRMRALYARRGAALIRAVRRHAGDLLEVRSAYAGLHLVGWLSPGVDDRAAAERA